uniref:LOW QUALITY PROTEIN: NACHT, LRR and PYD domains-containing protein 3-like n=1 Tax=Phascolarctos cinereus TaxID=38626 RepID=A0A6P5J8X5_PHACI|nr:LOW QUALITY PROTEIN: NACHT, LRR and PYD domains-containing protein 3-like [Phascolarctos cinereus]
MRALGGVMESFLEKMVTGLSLEGTFWKHLLYVEVCAEFQGDEEWQRCGAGGEPACQSPDHCALSVSLILPCLLPTASPHLWLDPGVLSPSRSAPLCSQLLGEAQQRRPPGDGCGAQWHWARATLSTSGVTEAEEGGQGDQESPTTSFVPPPLVPQGYKEKYRECMRKKFQVLEERNGCLGEWVYLSHHYTWLLLVREPASPQSRQQQLLASRGLHGCLQEGHGRPIELKALFDADGGEGGSAPATVVLQEVAGIGKTTLARKVPLDWASGTLYPGQFDYAFYVNCRTVELAAQRSVAELLSGWLKGTGPGSGAPVPTMLARPECLLFVLDGFDELLWGTGGQEYGAWVPRREKQRVDVHLRSLLAKRLLPEYSLLVTTWPMALEKLQQPQVAEVLGFHTLERQAYFYKYFPNLGQAGRAWATVQANEVLFTMCFVLLVCWAVCTGLRQQVERGKALVQTARTTITIYTAFLSSLLRPDWLGPPRSRPAGLWALCSLAATGQREQRLWFRQQDLACHGLDVATVSTFLHTDQVQHEVECKATYSFFHSTFQEFFTALFLVLKRMDSMALP